MSGTLRELLTKKPGVSFSAGTARSATTWPPVNCVCVPQLFEQLINTTLCPAFLRKFVCQPLCCVPLQKASNTNVFYQCCPRRLISCWLLTNTAVASVVTNFRCRKLIAKVNKQKNSAMENLIFNQYGERFAILKTENIKMCGWITKLEATKNAICSRFLPHLQKIWSFLSQSSVATCLRWGGYCRLGFVANFIRFPAVQKLWKSVKIWQRYRQLKGGNFFETWCTCTCHLD